MARDYQSSRGFVTETGTRQYQSVGAYVNESVVIPVGPPLRAMSIIHMLVRILIGLLTLNQ